MTTKEECTKIESQSNIIGEWRLDRHFNKFYVWRSITLEWPWRIKNSMWLIAQAWRPSSLYGVYFCEYISYLILLGHTWETIAKYHICCRFSFTCFKFFIHDLHVHSYTIWSLLELTQNKTWIQLQIGFVLFYVSFLFMCFL